MKKIVLIACFSMVYYFGYAQNKAAADDMYGTKSEQAQQEQISAKSNSGYLCRFVGFKGYYINNLALYLQEGDRFSLDQTAITGDAFVFSFVKKQVTLGTVKPLKLALRFNVNARKRITNGTISGEFADLAGLFINYWPMSADWISEAQLKPGVVAQKHSFGDLISFKWSAAGKPYITVTADPNISIPVPTR